MRHATDPSSFRATLRRSVSLATLAAALAALAACNKPPQGLVSAAPPPDALAPIAMSAPLVDAPTPQALPAAQPARIGHVATRSAGYAFADRAYALATAFDAAPPDYAYAYEGVQPWVWRSYDGSECIAEAVPGGERIYYYEPGADEPFFIQDPGYGYGFEDGELAALYDSSGEELADADAAGQAEWAGRYLARARALYEASRYAPRQAVAEQNWRAQRPYIDAPRRAWTQQLAQNAGWQSYHQQYYPAAQAHYASERQQRLAWAAHVDQANRDPVRAQRELAEAQRIQQQFGAQQAGRQAFAQQATAWQRRQPFAQQQMIVQHRGFAAQQQATARQPAVAAQRRAGEQGFARQQTFELQPAQQQAAQRARAQQQAQQQGSPARADGQGATQGRSVRFARQPAVQQQAMTRQGFAAQRAVQPQRAQTMAEPQLARRAAESRRQDAGPQARFAAEWRAQPQSPARQSGQVEAQRQSQMMAEQQRAARAQQAAAQQQRQAGALARASEQRALQAQTAQAHGAQAHAAQAAAAQVRAQQAVAGAQERHSGKKG